MNWSWARRLRNELFLVPALSVSSVQSVDFLLFQPHHVWTFMAAMTASKPGIKLAPREAGAWKFNDCDRGCRGLDYSSFICQSEQGFQWVNKGGLSTLGISKREVESLFPDGQFPLLQNGEMPLPRFAKPDPPDTDATAGTYRTPCGKGGRSPGARMCSIHGARDCQVLWWVI